MLSARTGVIDGTHAISYAVQRSRARVVAAYAISPAADVIALLSQMCGAGPAASPDSPTARLDARFVSAESDYSALATCAGASQAGLRTFTVTAGDGLAYMHQMLHWCAAARLPIVLATLNRSMGEPWNVLVDQNDSLSQRDTGWIQYYCEDNQDALDTIVQAFRVAEHVRLPAMVCVDALPAFQASEPVVVPDQKLVDAYLPDFRPSLALDTDKPGAFGAFVGMDSYMDLRARMEKAMDDARVAAIEANEEYATLFGRRHPIVETYPCDDARATAGVEAALVTSGAAAGTARAVVDECLRQGRRVRLVKLRLFRPFPFDAVRAAVAGARKIAVFDRNISFGHGGIMASEVRAALHSAPPDTPPVPLFSFVGGLGGHTVASDTLHSIINYTLERTSRNAEHCGSA
jgi:pyruvate/2-oxoacid:ferredoxin oxidoreductase alpha subunit